MQRIRRLAAVVGVTAIAGAFATSPAGAATKEVYLGSAAARGLNVRIANPVNTSAPFQATLGSAFAQISSAQEAKAEGIGQLLPVVLDETKKTAEVKSINLTEDEGSGCATAIPVQQIAAFGLACGSAFATTANGLPIAKSTGSVAGLNVDGQVALDQLGAVTTPVGDALSGVLDQVCDSLEQSCDATTTVKDLVESILKTRTLEVGVGESDASVVTEAGKVTSSAKASGAVVRLLPLPQVNGLPATDPLATIEVSSAKATAVYDRVAGKSLDPVADPAVVRVRFNTVLTESLGVSEIAVTPGQTRRILEGLPLESEIRVASTQVVENADKTKGVIADGVRLHLAMGLGETAPGAKDGGIILELAHAEAGIAGAPETKDPIVPNVEIPRSTPQELPRTGGTPWVPMAGVSILALAVLARRATTKAAASR